MFKVNISSGLLTWRFTAKGQRLCTRGPEDKRRISTTLHREKDSTAGIQHPKHADRNKYFAICFFSFPPTVDLPRFLANMKHHVEKYRKTRVSASLLVRVATPEPILPEASFISRSFLNTFHLSLSPSLSACTLGFLGHPNF